MSLGQMCQTPPFPPCSSTTHFFTTLGLTKGYWQTPLFAESKEKMAFPSLWGLYTFVTLHFGLFGALPPHGPGAAPARCICCSLSE